MKTHVLLLTALMNFCLMLSGGSSAQQKQPDPPVLIPDRDTVAAWQRYGFKTGWLGQVTPGINGKHLGLQFIDDRYSTEGLHAAVPTFEGHSNFVGKIKGKTPPPDLIEPGVPDSVSMKNLPQVNVPFGLELSGGLVTDERVKDLARFKNLTALNIFNLSDERMKDLAALQSLHYLKLTHASAISDIGLKQITELKSLTHLDVNESYNKRITDGGLKELAAMKILKGLYLRSSPTTNEVLKELSTLSNLTSLDLESTKVTNAGVKELAVLKNLKELSLNNNSISNGGLKELAALDQLSYLGVSGLNITDGVVGTRRNRLRCLRVSRCREGSRPEQADSFGGSGSAG